MSPLARQILDYLKAHAMGRACAVKIKDVAHACGVDRRAVELAGEEIRDSGVALCSATSKTPMGLYIAVTYEDFRPFDLQIDSRIKKMARRQRRMRKMFLKTEESSQLTLEL